MKRHLRDFRRVYFEWQEDDRVNHFEDYNPDRPPRPRHGFWSWNKDQWMTKDHSVIQEEEEEQIIGEERKDAKKEKVK